MSFNGVYAAYPAYKDGVGNIVIEIREDGPHEVEQCFATYRKHWAEKYGRDWHQMIHESEAIVGKMHNHVVLLSKTYSLLPIKMRTPIIKDDGANGYVCVEKILDLVSCDKGTLITMENEIQIFTMTHKKTIEKDIKRSRALKNDFILHDNNFVEELVHRLLANKKDKVKI
ncbi:hypothetical protein SANA_29150 [Gottschalkiaceae bacterium SANA]|nr:hypothetical protein SANA_29150 [Gottschalkiaceae bacterium SANA]